MCRAALFAVVLCLVSKASLAQLTLALLTELPKSAVSTTFSNAIVNTTTNRTEYTATVRNVSAQVVTGTLYLVIDPISASTVAVVNPTGTSTEGKPYFLLPATSLAPGATTSVKVTLFNPNRVRFTFSGTTYLQIQQLPALALNINTPGNGSVFDADRVVVSGEVQGPANTGVTVNGIVASLSGNQFFANVPLRLGDNPVVAVATAPDGRSVQQSITVNASGASRFEMRVTPATGVAPLNVTFSVILNGPGRITRIEADFDGNGTTDATYPNGDVSIGATYNTPGTYSVRIAVIDDRGTRTEQTIAVVVNDRQQMDQQFRTAWAQITAALANKDINSALQGFTNSGKARYEQALVQLFDQLPQIVTAWSSLELVTISDKFSEYLVTQSVNGSIQSHFIYFLRGADGVWRLHSM